MWLSVTQVSFFGLTQVENEDELALFKFQFSYLQTR